MKQRFDLVYNNFLDRLERTLERVKLWHVVLVVVTYFVVTNSPIGTAPSEWVGNVRYQNVSDQVLLEAAQKEISTALGVRDTGVAVDAYPYSDDAAAWRKVSEKLAGRYGTLQKDYVMTAVDAKNKGLMPQSRAIASVFRRLNRWDAPILILNVEVSNGSCKLLLKGKFTGPCEYTPVPDWMCVTGRNMPCVYTEQAFVRFREVDGEWHIRTIAPYQDLQAKWEIYIEESYLLDPYSCFTLSRNRLDC
jgi:hypothetical protein